MQPKVIIESGGKDKALGYLKSLPKCSHYSLDIDFSKIIYVYIGQDFSYLDVQNLEKEQTICFFDDHQNALI